MIKNVGKNLFLDCRYYCLFVPSNSSFKVSTNNLIKGSSSIRIYFIPDITDSQINERIPHFIINYTSNGFFETDQQSKNSDITEFVLFLNNNLDHSLADLSEHSYTISDIHPKLKEALFFSANSNYTNRKLSYISMIELNIQVSPVFFFLDLHNAHGITNEYLFENKIKIQEWKEIIAKDLYPFRYASLQQSIKKQRIVGEWLRHHLSDHCTNK